VTPPEQRRLTPKQAGELSAAHGEGPAGAVAAEGTRHFVAGKEPGAFLCSLSLGAQRKRGVVRGRNPAV